MVDAQVIPHLVRLLDSGELQVMTPSLRTLGNMVTGNDTQTDAVLQHNAVPVFAKLLQHPKMNIVKVARAAKFSQYRQWIMINDES